jgi:pSer/pThr/pTyr-binding forkhead associated (FHA) protein
MGAPEGTSTVARRLVDGLFAGSGAGAPSVRVVRGAPPLGLALAVAGRAYVVGRAEGCALSLPVEEVSREHAAFVRDGEGVVVRDLGSKNGVTVAGARVVGERRLADGDEIVVGPVTLAFEDPAARHLRELERPPAEAPPPPAAPAPADATPTVPPDVVVEPVAPRRGSTQIIVGVALAVLALLAVALGVLVFGRG